MDVASWLRSLGLEKYEPEPRFSASGFMPALAPHDATVLRGNEIDADVLPELTKLDREKLVRRWDAVSVCSRPSRLCRLTYRRARHSVQDTQ